MTVIAAPTHPIDALRGRVAGAVVLPDDADWDDVRQAWNLAVDQRPAAVVLVESVEDIRATVDFARTHGLRIAAQGTGHGACSLPPLDSTILVKTSRLRGVEIDARTRRARVEAGALWADVVAPAAERGFVVLHGSSPDVGVMGYTLGGGIGWLARSHGLAANSITAIEIVTADGRLVWADHETEPDLFWAVRGGGGSFGVVSAIEIELFETPELYAGAMFWPVERAPEVLRAWRTWTDTVSNEVMSVGRVMHFPPLPHIPEPLRGNSFAIVEAVFAGGERDGAEVFAPLRALEPAIDTFGAVGPMALTELHMDPKDPIPAAGDGMFVETLPLAAIDAVFATAVPPLLTLEIRHLGGALAMPSSRHGAVGSIDADFVMFAAGHTPTADAHVAVVDAIDRAKRALAPWETERTYFNFSERPIDPARLFPPATLQHLRDVRAAYDPAALFVSNHPIH
jgi:FAD/FMN-containing dehydrogenase